MADVETLMRFHNRHSCASSPESGVNRAAAWIQERYQSIAGLKVFADEFTMPLCGYFSSGVKQKNIVAVLEGQSKAQEIIVLGGHYDSRESWNLSSTAYAPGANDSGSQTAVLLEVARVLAARKYARTIVFVAFAGEEQGHVGSEHFVANLKKRFPGKRVIAMLNFDIVGGDSTANDEASLNQFRLYAPAEAPHLPLAERIREINERLYPEFKMILHKKGDRWNRGGDQLSFQAKGIPAVRLIESKENMGHQHNDQDLPEYVTPAYMARMAKLAAIVAAELAERE